MKTQAELISHLRSQCGGWIMGGYVRDSLLEKPTNDIDMYIRVQDYCTAEQFLHDGRYVYEENSEGRKYDHPYIHSRISCGDVDIIVLEAHVTHMLALKSFDIGLCMVAITDTGSLVKTPQFRRDVLNRTLTVYRTQWGVEHVDAHLARLRVKYPDFTVVRESPNKREN